MRSLNLLHYPSQARQQKVFHRWWSSLAGLLLGGALAWGWLQWQDLQTTGLQQEQKRLQANLAARTQQAKEAAHRQTQSRMHAQQLAHLKQVGQQQQAWLSLHDSLQTEARLSGLRLERLQAESEKIELHGSGMPVDRVNQAQRRLSDQLEFPLTFASITATGHEGVSFVLQAMWPFGRAVSSVSSSGVPGAKP